MFRHRQIAGRSPDSPLNRLDLLNIRIYAINYDLTDQEWCSNGRIESDSFHHLEFVSSGSASIMHQGERLDLQPGGVYWLPGNTPLERLRAERYQPIYAIFGCELIEGVDILLDRPQRCPLKVGHWAPEKELPDWVSNQVGLTMCLRLKARIMQVIIDYVPEIDEIVGRQFDAHRRFESTLQLIDKNIGANIRVSELAEAYGLSLHSFSMAFARHFGISPKAFLNRRLNQKACLLLTNTTKSIRQVAQEMRFEDERYFSRFFTKMNGCPPAEYRKRWASRR